MTDTPPVLPPLAPVVSSTSTTTDDWPSIVGVVCIAVIAITALWRGTPTDHDIAVAAVGALGGWLTHGAVKKVIGQ